MEDITVLELKKKLDSNDKFIFLDVREPHEYEDYNLNARLIPLGTLPDKMSEFMEEKDTEIIIHCRSGARSGNAKQYMAAHGFTKVRNVLGGVLAWKEEVDV